MSDYIEDILDQLEELGVYPEVIGGPGTYVDSKFVFTIEDVEVLLESIQWVPPLG